MSQKKKKRVGQGQKARNGGMGLCAFIGRQRQADPEFQVTWS